MRRSSMSELSGEGGLLHVPNCGHRIARRAARILKARDFLFVVRHPGVYCDACYGLIFNERQAKALGIPSGE